jgi:hypothetical protein
MPYFEIVCFMRNVLFVVEPVAGFGQSRLGLDSGWRWSIEVSPIRARCVILRGLYAMSLVFVCWGSLVGLVSLVVVAGTGVPALALAAECDRAVEVEPAGVRGAQHAPPDGTVRLESYLRPRWAFDEAGCRVEVDPTLVVAAGGGLAAEIIAAASAVMIASSL